MLEHLRCQVDTVDLHVELALHDFQAHQPGSTTDVQNEGGIRDPLAERFSRSFVSGIANGHQEVCVVGLGPVRIEFPDRIGVGAK